MKRFGISFIMLAGLVSILFPVACQKEAPEASPVSIARGGLIYDNWLTVIEGAPVPKDNQPLWSLQSTNTRTGNDTWRCKECHGWDYKGKDGAYGKGSHVTGFTGVYDASLNKTKAQLSDVLNGKSNAGHNFATALGEADLNDAVNFLKEGVIDETKYIDSATKKAIGVNAANGRKLYSGTCAACHGADGAKILFDGKNSLGFLANDNPWEALHKLRFGQPGTKMPSGFVVGWSIQDTVDVLGYSQTLPK